MSRSQGVSRIPTGSGSEQASWNSSQPVDARVESGLRAGDAERDQLGAVLSEALAAGYLSMEEFETRTEEALTARTVGELAALQQDLPIARPVHATPATRSVEPVPPAQPDVVAAARRGLRSHLASYVGVMALLIGIWLVAGITAGAWYFWPIWPMLGWGIGVVSHVVPVLTGRQTSGSCRSLAGR